jgi:ATP-dependent Clp protease ATP-binding subunit ClpA
MKDKVEDELKKHFRPEFLNRIDDIIVFHQLTEAQIISRTSCPRRSSSARSRAVRSSWWTSRAST